MASYALDRPIQIRGGYDLRVFIPLIVITAFCFGFVIMHPFKVHNSSVAVNYSDTKQNVLSQQDNIPSFSFVGTVTINAASPAEMGTSSSSTTTSSSPAVGPAPVSVTSPSAVQTATPQAAVSSSESTSAQGTNIEVSASRTTQGKTVKPTILKTTFDAAAQFPNETIQELLSN